LLSHSSHGVRPVRISAWQYIVLLRSSASKTIDASLTSQLVHVLRACLPVTLRAGTNSAF
jgi:hypothetical protein